MIADTILMSRIAHCDSTLRRSGATCTYVSESRSRYFDLPGRGRVRVSDHMANGGGPDERWAVELLVDHPDWLAMLAQLTAGAARVANDVPASIYFDDYEAWSQSMLKTFLDRRRLAEAYYILGIAQEPPDNSPIRKGTATHTALLEPHRFERLVVKYPPGILAKNGAVSTNEAKAFRDEHEKAGRVVLKDAEYAAVRAMAESVKRTLAEWLDAPSCKEEVVYWADESTGLPCKSRLDWRIETDETNVVLDLKSTGEASPSAFRQRVKSNRYWLQDSQYRDAATSINGKPTDFYFVVVEDSFPYACAIHRLDIDAAGAARSTRANALQAVAKCRETGDWSEPWESSVNPLSLQPWDFNPN